MLAFMAIDSFVGDRVQKRYKNLRDYFRQIEKDVRVFNRSGSGDTMGEKARKKPTWALYEHMLFLKDINKRST